MSEQRVFEHEPETSLKKEADVMPIEQTPKKQGWQKETEIRQGSINKFLQQHLQTDPQDRARYDHIHELHFSGMNADVMSKIAQGSAKIIEVAVFYKDGKPDSLHAIFESEGKGHNIDVYLQGSALEDYLASENGNPKSII